MTTTDLAGVLSPEFFEMWPCALRALLRALVALGTLAAAQGQLRHLPPGLDMGSRWQ